MLMNKCQWIGKKPALVPACKCDAIIGRSYCKDHIWLVYQQGTAIRKRKKDISRAAAIWDIESEFHEAVAELIAAGEIEL